MKQYKIILKDQFSGCTDIKTLSLPLEKLYQLQKCMEKNICISTFENNIHWQWIIKDIKYINK